MPLWTASKQMHRTVQKRSQRAFMWRTFPRRRLVRGAGPAPAAWLSKLLSSRPIEARCAFWGQLDYLGENDDWRRHDGPVERWNSSLQGAVSIVQEAHIVARSSTPRQPTVASCLSNNGVCRRRVVTRDDLHGTVVLAARAASIGNGGRSLVKLAEGANVLIKHHDVSDFDIDPTVALLNDAASTVRQGAACKRLWRPKGWGWFGSLRAYPRRPWRLGERRARS